MTACPDLFTWLRALPHDSRLHQVPMGERKSLWEFALDALEQVGELRLWEPGRAGYAAVQQRVLDAEAEFRKAADKERASA